MIRMKTVIVGILLLTMIAVCTQVAYSGKTRLDAKTMRAALRTATKEEDGFLDHVVKLMEDGQLPQSMVESTFQWARQKPDHRFQYFKHGLIARAEKAGYKI
jgi:hypothetical protein